MITVFTPTYNRAYILPQLYNSLVKQTVSDFEWVIVDDGSIDNTKEVVSAWINAEKITIRYFFQENQGKHIAINTGVKNASGELFFIVDSDDSLKETAIEQIMGFWEKEAPDDNISGIISYRQFTNGKLVGNKLPQEIKSCKLRETNQKYQSYGDKVVIYRTEILRQYPYPKFIGEKFLGESYVFNQIDDVYDMLVMDAQIYLFDYQLDGLSQNFRELYRKNPNGFLLIYEQSLQYCINGRERLKTKAHIVCLRIRLKKSLRRYMRIKEIGSLILGVMLYGYIFLMKSSNVKPYKESED